LNADLKGKLSMIKSESLLLENKDKIKKENKKLLETIDCLSSEVILLILLYID
jgi:hypothetical protein